MENRMLVRLGVTSEYYMENRMLVRLGVTSVAS